MIKGDSQKAIVELSRVRTEHKMRQAACTEKTATLQKLQPMQTELNTNISFSEVLEKTFLAELDNSQQRAMADNAKQEADYIANKCADFSWVFKSFFHSCLPVI